MSDGATPSRWAGFFPWFYRFIHFTEPAIRLWLRHGTLADTVEMTVTGRRSGEPRTVLIGLLRVDDRRYVGHPSQGCAWTANLEAAGVATITPPRTAGTRVRAVALAHGPERDAAIRATFRQHPFPGNVVYWLARAHVRAAGRFYRLEPAA